MNYTLTKVLDRVYLLKFEEHYDLCMTFLRYQEFYESSNPQFRGQKFNLLDYMEWFAKKYGKGVFTYPDFWAGFNLPSSVIAEVWRVGIDDRNHYDKWMWELHNNLRMEVKDDFYLIGVSEDGTIDHEVAHGLYYIDQNFRNEMDRLVESLPSNIYAKICTWLKESDYNEAVFKDEIQAYMATGWPDSYKGPRYKSACKPFIKTFHRYVENYAQVEKQVEEIQESQDQEAR